MLISFLKSLVSSRKAGSVDFPAAYAMYQRGLLDEAERACATLVAMPPSRAAALYLQGLIAERRGKSEPAGELFALAVADQPEPTYRLALASSLKQRGAAEAAAREYELSSEALPEGDPRRYQAALEAAWLRYARSELELAEASYRRALLERPDDLRALDGLAETLYAQCREQEAVEAAGIRIARQRDTGRVIRGALMAIPPLCDSLEQIEAVRGKFDAALDGLLEERLPGMADPVREVGLLPFYLAYHGKNDRELMEKFARLCRASYQTEARHSSKAAAGRKRVRVGFVSTFFHSHSVGRTTLGLISGLPRDALETWVFAIAPAADPLAARIRAAADRYVTLPDAVNLAAARTAIAEADLDVLVFADIGMHPLTYFLAFWRLAPIQLNTWGHPVTSGIDTLDYYFSSSDLEVEGSEAHYTERLVRGRSFFLPGYERPAPRDGAKSRAELGLPEGALYLCPQTLFKLGPDFDAALGGILERDPLGRILLFEAKTPVLTHRLRERLSRRLGGGVARVDFLPRASHADFLRILGCADVVLDPFGFSGANTNAEALAMGVPIMTLTSRFLRGRFGTALCEEIETHECIAADAADYVVRAVSLARDRDQWTAARAKLLERSGVLFERGDSARALGECLLELVEAAR